MEEPTEKPKDKGAGGRAGRGEKKARHIRGLPKNPETIRAFYQAAHRLSMISRQANREAKLKALQEASDDESHQ